MATFYLTIGQKYRDGSHPECLHPDGFCRIEASDEWEARMIVANLMGPQFASIYTDDYFNDSIRAFYPLGQTHHIEALDSGTYKVVPTPRRNSKPTRSKPRSPDSRTAVAKS